MSKKFMLLFALASFIGTASAQTPGKVNWAKSTTGVWVGKDNMDYKYNTTTKVLSVSKDHTTWATSPDGMWQGFNGTWYRITEGKLMTSPTGKIWTTSADGVFQGGDSKWYKFDSNLVLMVKKFG
jgi:hypothetical protein